MKSLFTFFALILGLTLPAQNLSPFVLLNLELTAADQIVPYDRVVMLDPSIQPPDSLSDLRLTRSFNGNFTSGYEVIFPFKDTANWVCTVQGLKNEIAILNPANRNDTLQKEIIFKNNQGQDTATYIYLPDPNGNLQLFQSTVFKINNQSLVDSLFVYNHMRSTRSLFAVLTPIRNANGQTDTLLVQADIGNGTLTPVQLFTYQYNQNVLNSVELFDPFTSPTNPIEIFTMAHNANDEISRITVSERNPNNGEYDPYEIYFFFERADLSNRRPAISQIEVYPNPSSTLLQITTPGEATVKIMNSAGTQVKIWHRVNAQDQLSIEDLANGPYLLKIEIQGQTQEMKIIKS
jgi:hypothetical protein